jgi:hypothetical protein
MAAAPAPFSFTCACCGKTVTELPDLAYPAPLYYFQLPEAERETRARLGSDFCVIDGEDRFIRVVCPLPIQGTELSFSWGVWVSLSADNFQRYEETFDNPGQSKLGGMFGWFSNRLPDYPDTLNLQSTIWPQDGNQRPRLYVNAAHAEHPLYVEQCNGIDADRLGRLYANIACDSSVR